MYRKSVGFLVVTLLTATVVLPAVGPKNVTDSTISAEENTTNPMYTIVTGILHPHPQPVPPVRCKTTLKPSHPEAGLSTMDGDIVIADSPNDDVSPVITKCFDENFMVAYAEQADILTSHVVVSISTDGGNYWEPYHFYWDEYNTNPGVTYAGNRTVTGWMLDPSIYEANPCIWIIEDEYFTDSDEWRYSSWYWEDYNAYDWHDMDLAGCLPYEEKPFFWGLGSFIGSVYYEGWAFATDAPFIMTDYSDIWPDLGPYVFGCTPIPQWNDSRTSSVCVDQNTERGYIVCDFLTSGAETYSLGIVHVPLPTLWEGGTMWYYAEIAGGDSTSYADPDISVSEGSGYIACETDENGNQDIICFYSNEGFNTTTKTFIADSPDDETNPSIVSYGDAVQCTFTKNGNLYATISTDYGETWSEPEQINDEDSTVVSGWRSSELIIGGNTVWMDNRNGNIDIFFDSIGGPAYPNIEITEIIGGFGVSAVIENTGTGDATNVQWSLDLEGGLILVGGHNNGTISTLTAGTSETVKIPFVFGLGGVTIAATADGATKTAAGTVLLFLITGVQ